MMGEKKSQKSNQPLTHLWPSRDSAASFTSTCSCLSDSLLTISIRTNDPPYQQWNENLKKTPKTSWSRPPHPLSSHLEITHNHLALSAFQEPQTSKSRRGSLCSAHKNITHTQTKHSNKGKNMQPHPLRKNLVCHFPSLSTREGERKTERKRKKRACYYGDW